MDFPTRDRGIIHRNAIGGKSSIDVLFFFRSHLNFVLTEDEEDDGHLEGVS